MTTTLDITAADVKFRKGGSLSDAELDALASHYTTLDQLLNVIRSEKFSLFENEIRRIRERLTDFQRSRERFKKQMESCTSPRS